MESDSLHTLRHSAAHVLAQAVQKLYPTVQIAIGPPIDYGCYYDFLFSEPISDADFKAIEKEMRSIINKGQAFETQKMKVGDAVKYWKAKGQKFKVELIEDLKKAGEKEVTFYKNVDDKGEEMFVDLCKGGHLKSTKEIPADAFKIMSLAGAYWHGDEKNEQLTRIYMAVFPSKEELVAYITMMEEAKKRDHRKIGKEMDLFSFHEEAGPGLVYWHPHGGMMRKVIEDFWREQHISGGYDFVYSPHVGREWLWQTSGHLDFYKENMYAPMDIDDEQYFIKPMNCPFHILMYKNSLRSYRELPLRWAELGTVYRYEKSGVLHGLMRVRGFTQDDAHIMCTPEQIEDEVARVLRFSIELLRAFGFQDICAFLSTRPEKAVGEPARWEQAQKALERAIKAEGLVYEIDEGGGAFYGPKIDLKIRDAIGREWQLTTIQFDFNLPERFDMTYIGEDGKEHQPYMVHRALLGSIERFFGILVEHYAGLFPLWLAPVQVAILPVAAVHEEYAQSVLAQLREKGVRAEVLDASESLGKRIREGEKRRIPYLLVLGDTEKNEKSVAVRNVKTKEQVSVPFAQFVEKTVGDIAARKLEASFG
ncbi:MAG: threonine--tRNA ligase [Candidatus Peribacteraceae bacterium]|jgi:threonyl-tRNA synthetase